MEKDIPHKWTPKVSMIAILISDKTNFKVIALNTGALKLVKKLLLDLTNEIDSNRVIGRTLILH